jgi:hypothetical protein
MKYFDTNVLQHKDFTFYEREELPYGKNLTFGMKVDR